MTKETKEELMGGLMGFLQDGAYLEDSKYPKKIQVYSEEIKSIPDYHLKAGTHPGKEWEFFTNKYKDSESLQDYREKGYLILDNAFDIEGNPIDMVSVWRPRDKQD